MMRALAGAIRDVDRSLLNTGCSSPRLTRDFIGILRLNWERPREAQQDKRQKPGEYETVLRKA